MTITKMNTARFAAAMAAAMVLVPVSAQAQDVLETSVISAKQATQVNLGSKKAVGYFGKSNGKCDVTVMVIEASQEPNASDASAARMKVAIAPGATASIESVQGRTVSFFCGSGARRMVVMTTANSDTTPRS